MIQLEKGSNNVALSQTSSFTPIIEFDKGYTGVIKIIKSGEDLPDKQTKIKARNDEILDLSIFREYFTAYQDGYDTLQVIVNEHCSLDYEPIEDYPVESTLGKNLEFKFATEPHPKVTEEVFTEKCPMCEEMVNKNELMSHIQNKHMGS